MEFIYFFVKHSTAWTPTYHQNFFIDHDGFLWGFLGALIIGIIIACIFYFGCCISKNSSKYAKISIWTIFLLIASVIGYFYADLVKIGSSSASNGNESTFQKYSFYRANEDYYSNKVRYADLSQTTMDDLAQKKTEISDALDKYKDVRIPYDVTTMVLTAIFFFLTSVLIKRFTIHGRTIPFLKP